MFLLRLTQHVEKKDNYLIEIEFDDNGSRQTLEARFEFNMTDADRGDLRWYLEDYLQYPLDPAPDIAKRIEGRIREIGIELFKKIFQANDNTRHLWATLRDRLADTRVEVVTGVKDEGALPWEMLRDPKTDGALALYAKAFVRSYTKPAQKIYKPQPADKVRILLAICRPGGDKDIPFRSVSGRLLNSVTDAARERFELDVLRPPTFEQLSKTLRNAKANGKPYHIVHFDGHGGYLKPAEFLRSLIPLLLSGPREGSRGYLFFEHPKPDANNENTQLVDGPALGKLLAETDTPVLILNSSRSAHAEFQAQPDVAKDVGESQSQVRAFGSLAQEVMNEGVAGVVAMRYNVYVVTAAQFVADLYAALASGQELGESVSMSRKQLAAQPLREILFDPIPLQDWLVPVVYEAAPIQLFARVKADGHPPLRIDLSKTTRAEDNLPRPDVGFFGRDETILALDRAFDTQSVVLLHAYAGSGKTMTAAEFARWYLQTGGLNVGTQGPAPIFFTSFEQYKPMAQVLSAVEETYRPILEQNNIHWLALSDDDRLNLTLQIFQQIPPLWIWDNVEPINGFPAGADSAWSLSEQRELRTFMQIVTSQSKTKFLLTSRRDEREWLGDLPMRVTLPPMPMQERVQLTRALADKQGKRIADVKEWLPLLRFTQGNPLTITVMVGQALRDGISSKEQIEAYLNKLHNGETAFDDEDSEGRSKSLGASLSYGFEQAFSEDERKVLALLHFFQGFVDVDVLVFMGNPKVEYSLPELRHLTRDTVTHLLDKAADTGLLTSQGNEYYTIHPALPWFFKILFEQYYPNEAPSADQNTPNSLSLIPNSLRATRAYVESMGELGNYYHNQYEGGNRNVIASLRAEESNLLHARSLAREHGWWNCVIYAMQGLKTLYDHTGRRAEWKRLVEEIVPDFVGVDDLPLSGREKQWSLVTQYRVWLAQESHDWAEAERLQRVRVDWNRRRATSLLARPAESLSASEKNILRSLAVSIEQLGHIQREQGKPECADSYKESIPLYQQIGDRPAEAVLVFNLGHAYKDLPALRNLDGAERWYQRGLDLLPEVDRVNRGKELVTLGNVTYERFNDTKKEGKSEEELLKHLNTAADYFQQALALLSPDAVNDLAVTHNQLGNIYNDAGDLDRALYHYSQCIHYDELAGNQYGAGQTRRNIAVVLSQNGRLSDALLYARAALRNFEVYEGRAKQGEDDAKKLIAEVENQIGGK